MKVFQKQGQLVVIPRHSHALLRRRGVMLPLLLMSTSWSGSRAIVPDRGCQHVCPLCPSVSPCRADHTLHSAQSRCIFVRAVLCSQARTPSVWCVCSAGRFNAGNAGSQPLRPPGRSRSASAARALLPPRSERTERRRPNCGPRAFLTLHPSVRVVKRDRADQ